MDMNQMDDFEIEGLGFKPITKGLGFHGEKEKSPSPVSSRRQRAKSNTRVDHKSRLQHSPQAMPLAQHEVGLEAFYNYRPKQEAPQKRVESKKRAKTFVEATLSNRMFAYFVDVFVVTLAASSLFAAFSFLANGHYSEATLKNFFVQNYDFCLLIFFFFYLTYFTLLDGIGTIGKKMFNLQVISKEEGEAITIIQLFNRATLSFIGNLVFFIPSILDAHSSLSRTRTVVVNEK